MLRSLTLSPTDAQKAGFKVNQDGRRRTGFELLSYPDLKWSDLEKLWPQLGSIDTSIKTSLEYDARYSVYLDRQERDIKNYNKEQALKIPRDLDFSLIGGLSNSEQATRCQTDENPGENANDIEFSSAFGKRHVG